MSRKKKSKPVVNFCQTTAFPNFTIYTQPKTKTQSVALSGQRIKVNGRKDDEIGYVGLEKDLGPLTAKAPDPLKDEPIRPLEVCRKPKPKPLTGEQKRKLLENSYVPPTGELPSYLTLKISGKKQLEQDKNLVK